MPFLGAIFNWEEQRRFLQITGVGSRKVLRDGTHRDCCPEENFTSLKYAIFTVRAVFSLIFLTKSVPLRFKYDLGKKIIRIY